MIRVNLLEDQTAHEHKRFAVPDITGVGLICLAISLLTAAGMGTWEFHVHRQIEAATQKRAGLRTAELHMQEIKKQIEEYHRIKQNRRRRIDGIERLRKKQTDPLLLLNTILQSVPPDGDIWLTSLTQNSDNISIVGFTMNTEVIPDVMNNLGASGIFNTVDLQEIESQRQASKFSLLCSGSRKTQVE
jgi:Tfp pilus assembly protein PilN